MVRSYFGFRQFDLWERERPKKDLREAQEIHKWDLSHDWWTLIDLDKLEANSKMNGWTNRWILAFLELLAELIIRLFRNKKSYSSFEVLNCIYCCILHFVNQMSCLSLIIKVFMPPDDIISRYYIIAISQSAIKWCKDTTRTSIVLKIN